MTDNIDNKTVSSFGDEWSKFDQSKLSDNEAEKIFNEYFDIFPWDKIDDKSVGFDMGCGTGRWAKLLAPRVGHLTCIDPSDAINIARVNLSYLDNVTFMSASVDNVQLLDNSQDFGYSLGVLHHIPDTEAAIRSCAKPLQSGAPLLLYLYYAFDNRSITYKMVWRASNFFRTIISKLPNNIKSFITDIISYLIYYPLARTSYCFEKLGFDISSWPLSYYRNHSIYTMRTDSRDRFGTPVEHRFTKNEIHIMMKNAGFVNIKFSKSAPYWCVVGEKSD